jgi:hypothetical protein
MDSSFNRINQSLATGLFFLGKDAGTASVP